jgi:transmembrane protein TMEM174 (potassium channel)
MQKGRLEAFRDGVIAVIITIMVLEMRAPPDADFAALASTLPAFLTYALSYANVAIFWNNPICSRPAGGSMGGLYGRTCSCCFGYRSCPS